jgi:hypothetical protein
VWMRAACGRQRPASTPPSQASAPRGRSATRRRSGRPGISRRWRGRGRPRRHGQQLTRFRRDPGLRRVARWWNA